VFAAALERAVASCGGSSDDRLARAASSALPFPRAFGGEVLAELAACEKNRPCLQLLVDRWVPAAAMAFGRPGSAAETALLERRVKTVSAADGLARYGRDLAASLSRLGLTLPDPQRIGIDVGGSWS
jgi:1,2-phenylacetyl-CoA epoxidase catalytic subunit